MVRARTVVLVPLTTRGPAVSGACGSSGGSGSLARALGATAAVVSAHSRSLGTIPVDGKGRTVYEFANHRPDESTCEQACAADLPPVAAPRALPSALPAVTGAPDEKPAGYRRHRTRPELLMTTSEGPRSTPASTATVRGERVAASMPGPTPRTTSLVVMGVSGSGKSTTAAELVRRLGWDFAEGDEFHPPSNVAKMRAGIPLDDQDRWPWLRALAEWIGEHEAAGADAVVTCSALKRSYRDLLRDGHPSVWFAHVSENPELIRARLEHRTGHYMQASLLGSQLAILEPLQPDEPGAVVNGSSPPAQVADLVLAALSKERHLSLPTQEVSS